ncbi:sensor histidine kinase [Massilia sp. Dwa41.01b]|uniref:sensor histidine kinase n=1 Tax=Massilia sp. Dwa41.01b TaxID=2709302 RepID=UPI0015FEC36B|nr:ATP-binding protein [Massilia sp. Dwa41.01b]QNA89643.1 sensor histidine kinase [Massilia sp. Dwa41.01b]QNB01493.1 sensor histidine kinase [Massilia sp. Se16.2.3]
MTLRLRLGGYLLGLHVLLFVLAAVLLLDRPLLFVGAELALLASLAAGLALLRRALEPLGYTRRFHDLLQDQNYANRLAAPDSPELAELVGMFNALLATLHRERLAAGEQQGFLDRLLEATPSAVLVFDFDGAVTLLNASAHALLGVDAAHGRALAAWLDGTAPLAPGLDARGRERSLDLIAQLDALPQGESRLLTDTEGRRYRAQRGQFYDRGFARHFLMVEELTAELEDSERATYAKLVRVLAHEVNNTVAATRSVLDSLLFYRGQLTAPDAADFSTAIDAVKRRNVSLGEFIDRFTRVVKMPAPELRPVNIRDMVDDILWLNREQCASRGIGIGWRRCDAVAPRPMDAQLMEQALLNIVKNAIEAVLARQAAGSEGGHVEFALDACDGGALLSVSDSADLLGEQSPRQLFTPFFSTKPGGQGIGLMFVREVLTRHGFPYALGSTGAGETRFEIRFP